MDTELIKEFRALRSKIKTEDVMETALEMGCHYATVQRYLRGEVKKEIFGKKMLEVLKQKIVTRESNIAKVWVENSSYNGSSAKG